MSITPATPHEIEDVSRRGRKRKVVGTIFVLLVLAIFLPPTIRLNRQKARLTRAIGDSLGRKVTIDQVRLRLLPRPGFDLTNLTIQDDPAYGGEPIVHADSATAVLRLSSI